MSPHTHLLQSLRSIRPLSNEDWEMVGPKFKPVTFHKKERIIDAESVANSFLFISKGLARLYGYKAGEEITLFSCKPRLRLTLQVFHFSQITSVSVGNKGHFTLA